MPSHAPLGPDLHASLSAPFGSDIALSFGRELRFGLVQPYLDLRLGVSFLRWNIDARSSRLGDLASLDGTLVFPLFAPRLGVDFRLGHGINIAIAATAAPFGLARAGAFLGFGIATDEVLEAMAPPGTTATAAAPRGAP